MEGVVVDRLQAYEEAGVEEAGGNAPGSGVG